MLTLVLHCCSMSRLRGSNGASNVQASSLGSNTSMDSAKTAAAAQREPQALPDEGEQAREAAALVEWIHEQVCWVFCYLSHDIPCTWASPTPIVSSVLCGLAMHLQVFP